MGVDLTVEGKARDMHPIVRDEVWRIAYEAIRNACTDIDNAFENTVFGLHDDYTDMLSYVGREQKGLAELFIRSQAEPVKGVNSFFDSVI